MKTILYHALAIDGYSVMHIIIDMKGRVHVALEPFIVIYCKHVVFCTVGFSTTASY